MCIRDSRHPAVALRSLADAGSVYQTRDSTTHAGRGLFGGRYEGAGDAGTFLHLPLNANQIDENWQLRGFDGDRDVWHGAPVVAKADGSLIGFLIVEKRSAKVELVE